jgi:predicted Zn-dependent protease
VLGAALFWGTTLPAFSQSVLAAPVATTPGVDGKAELVTGTSLTQRGLLSEAIPHLLAARAGGASEYAAGFNLAICYLGTGDESKAIDLLERLRAAGHDTASVNNLLAQAYIRDGRGQPAFEAFTRASAQTPKDETLYAFVADACTDRRDYQLGLRVVGAGLKELPESARLHYERAVFLGRLDRFEEARPEFERAAALAPESYIGSLALVQERLYEDKYTEAIQLLRNAIQAGHRDDQTLSLLGTVLMKQGAAPGQPEFAEAKQALEDSAKQRPDYPSTEIALGKLYLMEGRLQDAVTHLEAGRRLEPENREVYAGLAQAYLKMGDRTKARECQTKLLRLNGKNE